MSYIFQYLNKNPLFLFLPVWWKSKFKNILKTLNFSKRNAPCIRQTLHWNLDLFYPLYTLQRGYQYARFMFSINAPSASISQPVHLFILLAQCNLPAGWQRMTVFVYQSVCAHAHAWLTLHKGYMYPHRYVLGWSICRRGIGLGLDPNTLHLNTVGHTPCAPWLLKMYIKKERQYKKMGL